MSSKDIKFFKRMSRIQLKPQTSGNEEVKSSTKVIMIGSTNNERKDKFAVNPGASGLVKNTKNWIIWIIRNWK